MALETSAQSPAPVRQIANAIAGWVDRLGAVWVEGQIAQLSRRPGVNTLFLYAREIRMVGLGELLARLERRRQLLAAEGLFAAELKRPLPFLPGKIGLVTAPSSAAERDVLENARRRWP